VIYVVSLQVFLVNQILVCRIQVLESGLGAHTKIGTQSLICKLVCICNCDCDLMWFVEIMHWKRSHFIKFYFAFLMNIELCSTPPHSITIILIHWVNNEYKVVQKIRSTHSASYIHERIAIYFTSAVNIHFSRFRSIPLEQNSSLACLLHFTSPICTVYNQAAKWFVQSWLQMRMCVGEVYFIEFI
jgi:hypothetical protein